ncbi:MAG TPA: hypothetical protein VJX67_00835 [Blastocatellia bacterium]|nr:hypothetical protein [Blastocatellia bacterium]
MTNRFVSRSVARLAAVCFAGLTSLATPGVLKGAAPGLAQSQSQPSGSSVQHEGDNWIWRSSQGGGILEVRIRKAAKFNEDYTDVVELAEGGSIKIKDTRARSGKTSGDRRLEVTRNPDGSVKRDYSGNGHAAAAADEDKRWLAEVLKLAARQGGLDAANRAKTLLKRFGQKGLLDEIAQLGPDDVKRIYLEESIKGRGFDREPASRILDIVSTGMKSDYDKSIVLREFAGKYSGVAGLIPEFLKAVSTISADHERALVLSAAVGNDAARGALAVELLKSAAAMKSDFEKANLLCRVRVAELTDGDARTAFFDAFKSISADYDKGRVLTSLLDQYPERDVLLLTINATAVISSDYEKAAVLVVAASRGGGDDSIRVAIDGAASQIRSEQERSRVLSATAR